MNFYALTSVPPAAGKEVAFFVYLHFFRDSELTIVIPHDNYKIYPITICLLAVRQLQCFTSVCSFALQ